MPTDKPRISVVVDEFLMKKIKQYMYQNGISTCSKAASELMEKGLARSESIVEPGNIYSGEEMKLIHMFRRATSEGRILILNAINRAEISSKHKSSKPYNAALEEKAGVSWEEAMTFLDLYSNADEDVRTRVLSMLDDSVNIDIESRIVDPQTSDNNADAV